MKTTNFILILLIGFLALTSCSDDDKEAGFTLGGSSFVKLDYEANANASYTFESNRSWTASSASDWLEVSPTEGKGGTTSLTTGAERTDTVTLTSGSVTKCIYVTQTPYIYLEAEEYTLDAAGGTLTVNISTSMNVDNVGAIVNYTSASSLDWLSAKETRASTSKYYIRLNVAKNNSANSRTANLYFIRTTDMTRLATVKIVQEGTTAGTSSDKSADGTIATLQTASIGNGIPIVLMGDGYIDTEIADGTYDEVMNQAMENLFSEEPIASLRDYFSVYSVVAVSDNNTFGSNYSTAFSCVLEGGGSTGISGDDDAVEEYIGLIDGLDSSEVLAVVLLNTSDYAGTTYWYMQTSNGGKTQTPIEFSIAYCPVIDSLQSESFREVLVHEAVGHGLAKLDDEYYYESYGAMPSDEITERQTYQGWGWCQIVDFTFCCSDVLWAQFISDETYAAEEVGVYEGACAYFTGAYRPTYNSMMNDNTVGFNPPSRKEIYDKVMERGTGSSPSYSDFVTFDLATNSNASLSTTRGTRSTQAVSEKRFTRPRVVKR